MKMRCHTIFFVYSLMILITLGNADAHPHPVMNVKNEGDTIIIQSLHIQKITEPYVKDNFVLRNCSYRMVEAHSASLETFITLKHDCANASIAENTLFRDYWKSTPILITTTGFVQTNHTESTSFTEDLRSMRVPSNPYFMIPFLFILGIIFTISGDFFSYILPVSISAKAKEDNNLWIKAWAVHVISTYGFLIFSLKLLSDYLVKSAGYIIISIGALMAIERYLQRKHLSPYLVALIPCAGSLFVSTIILVNHPFYSAVTPLVMNLGDLFLLKAGTKIPISSKHANKIPLIMLALGIIVVIKLSAATASPTTSGLSGGAGLATGLAILSPQTGTLDTVAENDTVTIAFNGRFEDQQTYGSIEWQTQKFIAGSGEMISGIDNATRGMRRGETKEVMMSPAEGYGSYEQSKIFRMPVALLGNTEKLIAGKYIGLTRGNMTWDVKVLEVNHSTAVLDANHPLAGKYLLYTIKIKDIQKSQYN